MARERSHEKGRSYQRAVMRWLCGNLLWRLRPHTYGDAYQMTSEAARLKNQYFDFSLSLRESDDVKMLLYAECKFRDEQTGDVNRDFRGFVERVCNILPDLSNEDIRTKIFMFISTVPPADWRAFLRDQVDYVINIVGKTDKSLIGKIAISRIHVVVLHMPMVE